MNKRNYAQRSNFMCGTDALDLLPFYTQTMNIPGITFGLPEIGGRSGTRLNMAADNAQFGSLSLEIIMDEDYQIYKDIIELITNQINVETGTFADLYFDFWSSNTDDMGRVVMKIEYYNCRIESVGDISLDAMDDTTEQTFALELKFDYFKIINEAIPTLTLDSTPARVAPIADAGVDQTIELGQSITIVGTALNGEGVPLTYVWTLNGLIVANTATFDYTPDAAGTFEFVLTVSDSLDASTTDTMLLIVEDIPPPPPPPDTTTA